VDRISSRVGATRRECVGEPTAGDRNTEGAVRTKDVFGGVTWISNFGSFGTNILTRGMRDTSIFEKPFVYVGHLA